MPSKIESVVFIVVQNYIQQLHQIKCTVGVPKRVTFVKFVKSVVVLLLAII